MAQMLFAVVSTDYSTDAEEHLIGLLDSKEAAQELLDQRRAKGQYAYIQPMQVGEILSAEEVEDRLIFS